MSSLRKHQVNGVLIMWLTSAVIYLLLFKTYLHQNINSVKINCWDDTKKWWSRKQGGIHTEWFGLTWAKPLPSNTKYSSSKKATQDTVRSDEGSWKDFGRRSYLDVLSQKSFSKLLLEQPSNCYMWLLIWWGRKQN